MSRLTITIWGMCGLLLFASVATNCRGVVFNHQASGWQLAAHQGRLTVKKWSGPMHAGRWGVDAVHGWVVGPPDRAVEMLGIVQWGSRRLVVDIDMLLVIAVGASGSIASVLCWRRMRRHCRLRRGLCIYCGYSVSGFSVCPECGGSVTSTTSPTPASTTRSR